MRTTGSTARKALAGLFLGVVMTLSLAGVAGAQASPSPSPSPSTTPTTTATTTATTLKTSGTLGRTGGNLALPLIAGGVLITITLGLRKLRTL